MILSTAPDGSSNRVDSGIDFFLAGSILPYPYLVYFFLHFFSAVNKKISSLSHKRDSCSLYFFLGPLSVVYRKASTNHQCTTIPPWRYRQTLRGVSVIWEFFIVFVFPPCFSSVFLLWNVSWPWTRY